MMDGSAMMGPTMGIFMLLFWGVVIFGLILAVRWLADRGKADQANEPRQAPLDILEQRYARGEIDREEFEQKKKDLG